MAHHLQPVDHPRRNARPSLGHRPSGGAKQVDQVEHILQRQGVVHRAALELPAIGENLLRHLLLKNRHALAQPALGFPAGKEQSGEHQRLGVGEQVIAKQVKLQPPRQVARLHREAMHALGRQGIASQRPLDPIDDTHRCRIGLPARTASRRILAHPLRHQHYMQRVAQRGILRVEVIEIVQVVAPQLGQRRIIPGAGTQFVGLVEETKAPGIEQARLAPRRELPLPRAGPQRRRRPRIGRRANQAEPQPPVDLDRLQMADRVPVTQAQAPMLKARPSSSQPYTLIPRWTSLPLPP